MLWLAASLWQRHLLGDEKLRVVYIPRWHICSSQGVLRELRLAFSLDDEIFKQLESCATPADVNTTLLQVAHSHTLVAVLDQVYDSPNSNIPALEHDAFFLGVANVITASSPRFGRQMQLLASTSGDVEALFLPSGLTKEEYVEYLRTRFPDMQLDPRHCQKVYELSGAWSCLTVVA